MSTTLGLRAEVLFVGATRPSMVWGATYAAIVLNAMLVMELFLLTKNLLVLLLAAPIHGVCAVLCARDARYFDLLALWLQTGFPSIISSVVVWKASSRRPLTVVLPNVQGVRGRLVSNSVVAAPLGVGASCTD